MLPRVYIADSDSSVARSIQFLLASEKIPSMVFNFGRDVIERALAFEPECIIAESMLPDMTGLRLMKNLAAEGVHAPVILLSTTDDIPSAVKAVKNGAWDYLEKPLLQKQLLRSVSQAIDLRSTHA